MRLLGFFTLLILSACWKDGGRDVHIDMQGAEGYLDGCASYWRLGDGGEIDLVNASLSSGRARLINVEFETSRVVAVPSEGGMISARISKENGTELFFVGGNEEVLSPLKRMKRVEGKPDLSPDEKRIAFHASNESGGLSIMIADLSGKKREGVHCSGNRCHSPVWSIDGNALYYLEGDRYVYRVSLSDHKERLVYTAREGGKVTGVAEISPDSVLISEVYGSYRTRNGGALKLVGLSSGVAESVASGEDEIVALSYAGSSHRVLYVKNIGLKSQRLYIYDVETGEEMAISQPGWIVGGASWNKKCIASL